MKVWPDRTPATCPSTLRVQRPCVECGGSFLIAPNIAERYLTCSKPCSSSRRSKMKLEALNPLWRGDGCRKETARARARRRFTLAGFVCEECGAAAAVDRHHKDGQPRNNDPANIARLCRRCHMLVDGRLEAVANVCASCHLDFGSVAAFDAHRVGKHAFTFKEGLKIDPPREDAVALTRTR